MNKAPFTSLTLVILVISSTLLVQAPLVEAAHLRVVAIVVPDTVRIGDNFTLEVRAEWLDLSTFAPAYPSYIVRIEICEGNDVATCTTLAFSPSESGEQVQISNTKTYKIELHAPAQARVWHLIAVVELQVGQTEATLRSIRRGGWAVVSSGGYDAWQRFEVPVKPNDNAVLTSQTLFTEDFESGLRNWQIDGITALLTEAQGASMGSAHAGKSAVLMGVDYRSNYGKFSLQRQVSATPGSDLTISFWYRGIYPSGRSSYGLPLPTLVFSVASLQSAAPLDQVTVNVETLTEAWQSLTMSVYVPPQTTTVILGFSGSGDRLTPPGGLSREAGYSDAGFVIDDVLAVERRFSAGISATASTTQVPTTASSATSLVLTTMASTATSPSPTLQTTSPLASTSVATESTSSSRMILPEMSLLYLVLAIIVVALLSIWGWTRSRKGKKVTPKSASGTPTPMFCMECGTKNPGGSIYCAECGRSFSMTTDHRKTK